MATQPLITTEIKKIVDKYSEQMNQPGHYGREKLAELGQMTKEKAGEYIQGAKEVVQQTNEKYDEMSEESKERAGEMYMNGLERGEEMALKAGVISKGIFEKTADTIQQAKHFVKEKIEHMGELIREKIVGPTETKISPRKVSEEQSKQTRA